MLSHILAKRFINRTTLFAIAAVILSSALAASARSWLRPSVKAVGPAVTEAKQAATTPPVSQGNSGREVPEGEVVTLTPNGFEPAEITRPHGRFILMVDNRSGVGELDLQLNRLTGTRLHEVHVPREQQDWNDIMELEPGSYVLTEAEHPKWTCRITITPR